MEQLILHLLGDYCTQSDWMAQGKRTRFAPAFWHALVYSLPFLCLASWAGWAVIFVTHFLIDRYGLAKYLVYAKNFLAPRHSYTVSKSEAGLNLEGSRWWHPWAECSATGYHRDRPVWLAVFLSIAADNTLHLAINYAAIRWL